MTTPPVALTIAATDSGGGAGILADMATFAALGVHGTCVVTATTAQDTTGVRAVHPVPIEIVEAQLDAVLSDLDPNVIKTGMLASAEVVELVARRCWDRKIVVDPVLTATTGAVLAGASVREAYSNHLLPVATVATPNRAEAQALGSLESITRIVTGGDLDGLDVLLRPGEPPHYMTHQSVVTQNDHGTGCTYSAALAAYLAHGFALEDAADAAGVFTAERLAESRQWLLGRGRGPISHLMSTSTTTKEYTQ